MIQSTRQTILGRVYDKTWLNKKFSRIRPTLQTHQDDGQIVSPVEAKVKHIASIDPQGELIGKNNRPINIDEHLQGYSQAFAGGTYINFYLSPQNEHFWVSPYTGKYIYNKKINGKSKFPIIVWLEKYCNPLPYLRKYDFFKNAVQKNATSSSVLETPRGLIAMIAIGSLNVNRIHTCHLQDETYPRWYPSGYFSLGSSMLLCLPPGISLQIQANHKTHIGDPIALRK